MRLSSVDFFELSDNIILLVYSLRSRLLASCANLFTVLLCSGGRRVMLRLPILRFEGVAAGADDAPLAIAGDHLGRAFGVSGIHVSDLKL